MSEDWKKYQYIEPNEYIHKKPNMKNDLYEVNENPYTGYIADPTDEEWVERPDEKIYGVFPTALKQNYNWKPMHVIRDFLTDKECEKLINYQENKIKLELVNNPNKEMTDDSDFKTHFRDEKVPNINRVGSMKKVYNRYLDKVEEIPRSKKWCGDDNLVDESGYRNWRNSTTTFVNPFTYDVDFIFYKVNEELTRMNNRYWKVDIPNPPTQEPLQITKYEAPIGNYSWHKDTAFGSYAGLRKLSYVVQLSDPTDYEGGYLQILDQSNNEMEAPKGRGTLIIFPSISDHRLTQVTKGTRYSAVGWVTGNHWR